MFCSNCGNSIETAQVFCVSCGQRLNAQSLATPVSVHQLSQPRVASTKLVSFESEVLSNKNPSKVDDTIGPKAITKSFTVKNKVLVFTTILVVVLLGVLQSHVQYGKLIGSIEISEEQMNERNNEIGDLVRELTKPTGGFLSDESRVVYENRTKYFAGMYESRIQNAGKTIDGVLLMPWNITHREVKKYYLAHNFAWQKNLASEKIDPYSDIYDDEVSSTWINFCSEIKRSVPWYSLGMFDSRIAKICISDADPTTN